MEIKKIYRVILFTMVYITTFSTSGQEIFLNPCVSFEDKIPQIKEYNERLERLLSDNFSADYIVRFVATPLINPEYAFQICEIDNSVFEISALTLKNNLWNTKDEESLCSTERGINEELVSAIETLFNMLIDSASTNKVYGAGEDGDTYYLIYNSKGRIKCAEAWMPSNNNLLNEVIQVCDCLIQYAQGKEIKINSLHSRIKLIIKRMSQ